jgi:hypothetical protein
MPNLIALLRQNLPLSGERACSDYRLPLVAMGVDGLPADDPAIVVADVGLDYDTR